MAAVWMRFRSELRSRLLAIVSLALIVGLMGGLVIWAAAGARRTETAYPRFVVAQHAMDIVVSPYGRDRARSIPAVERLPEVAQFSLVSIYIASATAPDGRRLEFPDVFPLVPEDGKFGSTLNALKILDGRAADPGRADEAVASFTVAEKLGIGPGDRIVLSFPRDVSFGEGPGIPRPPPIPVTVVGVGAAPGEFAPLAGGYLPVLHLTPAFYQANRKYFDPTNESLGLRLRRGEADVPALKADLRALRQRMKVGFDLPVDQAQQTAGVLQATRAQAITLWMLALLVGIAGLAIFAQSLSRQTFLESVEYPTLSALGVSPRQLLGVGILRIAAVGVAGAAIAVGIALALSPLLPTGVARIAEPTPGFDVDPLVIPLGAVGTVALVVLAGALPAWRAARGAASRLGVVELRGRPSVVAASIARLGRAPSAATGVRMALEPGRGRTAVPVRTTLLGTTLGMLALAAALAFGASLHHLASTPRLSGWNWDSLVGVDLNEQLSGAKQRAADEKLTRFLTSDRRVEAYAVGALPTLDVGGVSLLAIAMESRKGSVGPSVAEGRAPSSVGEIALGSDTMRSLGVSIGDTVRVGVHGTTATLRVVGRMAMPDLIFSFGRPGQGAAVSYDWLTQVAPLQAARNTGFFVRFAPGVAPSSVLGELRRTVPEFFVLPRLQSQQVANLHEVGSAPLVLAGIVALMAAATLAHTLVTSIRRRRRDLAILKTIGFSRRQVSATVAWQATTLAVVALAVGLPLGAAAGRWGWNALADRLGVVPEPVVPLVAVLLIVPATVAVANLVAAVPGWVAARTRPAEVLRSE